MNLLKQILPKIHGGIDTKAIARKNCINEAQAIEFFKMAAERLLDINKWGDFASKLNATFSLTDNSGVSINYKKPEAGNLIRIQLPGPPNIDGSGYDWVRIEKIEKDKDSFRKLESLQIQVRPVENPFDKKKETQAHLYAIDTTSTFAVIRKNNTVWVLELGRHKFINTNVNSIYQKTRSLYFALAAFVGLSTSQWKLLITGILNFPYHKIEQKELVLDYIYNRPNYAEPMTGSVLLSPE